MATKKTQSALNDAGRKVGKALARSGHTVEETGQKMKKAAEKMVKDAAKKAEKTMESAIGTIKAELSRLPAQTKLMPSEVSGLTQKKPAGAAETKTPLFKPGKGMTVEGQIGFLAGDIFEYLCENGQTPVTELACVMKKQDDPPLFGAALGWLAREAKISFSPCGTKVSLL